MSESIAFPFSVPLKLVSEPVRYQPVGHCIYCGATNGRLETEHVFPFGIAGNATLLPASTCRNCAKITGQIEQAFLRHLWWPLRARMGAPTRLPKERPESFTFRVVERNAGSQLFFGEEHPPLVRSQQIRTEDYPLAYLALLLPLPGILAGRPPTEMFEGQFWHCIADDEVNRFIDRQKEGMLLGPINPNTFARMLAKIAYAHAIGEGRVKFRPLVCELILGKTTTANYWVGGELELPPVGTEPTLHEVRQRLCTVNRQKTYVVVDIRLFAFLRTPIYHVVIGELEDELASTINRP